MTKDDKREMPERRSIEDVIVGTGEGVGGGGQKGGRMSRIEGVRGRWVRSREGQRPRGLLMFSLLENTPDSERV